MAAGWHNLIDLSCSVHSIPGIRSETLRQRQDGHYLLWSVIFHFMKHGKWKAFLHFPFFMKWKDYWLQKILSVPVADGMKRLQIVSALKIIFLVESSLGSSWYVTVWILRLINVTNLLDNFLEKEPLLFLQDLDHVERIHLICISNQLHSVYSVALQKECMDWLPVLWEKLPASSEICFMINSYHVELF